MENAVTRAASDSERLVIAPTERFAQVAADRIAQAINAAARGGRAHVALAGGNTPRAVYRELSQLRLPWDRVEIYFGDERAVPPSDPQSNYRMACETLLGAVPIPPSQVHRITAERADLDAAADDYAALLPDRLDLIVLGIGADGHTASLFPGSPALHERARKVVAVDAPKPPHRRLTMTPPVIESAQVLIVLAEGEAKAAAVARALSAIDEISQCPAQLAREGIWIVDRAAAAFVSGKSQVRV
jgi:6-phosphogluconolactonase